MHYGPPNQNFVWAIAHAVPMLQCPHEVYKENELLDLDNNCQSPDGYFGNGNAETNTVLAAAALLKIANVLQ